MTGEIPGSGNVTSTETNTPSLQRIHVIAVPSKKPVDTDEDLITTGDMVGLFFRDVGRYPLLKLDEERALTKTVAEGRTFDGINKTLETMHLTAEAEEAFATLVNSNLRLVISRAKKKQGRGLPFLDLINIGSIGLMKGIAKFEPERGHKLSTYCTWWIDQALDRDTKDYGSTIRIPVYFHDWLRYVRKEEHFLKQDLGRKPTIAELAEAVGSDPTYLEEALNIASKPRSFSLPLSDDVDSDELGDMIPDEHQSVVQTVTEDNMSQIIREAYQSIPIERTKLIIGLRYGLIDGNAHTLEEVGQMLNITRERVRQVENDGLKYMRRGLRVKCIEKEDVHDY